MTTPTILTIVLVILFIGIVIYLKWLDSPEQKGVRGEAKVSGVLSKLPEGYKILNDLVFKTERGTTQVDHVVLSRYGVFVIETKNYRGEIYGDESWKEWTQIITTDVSYRKKWYKTYTYVTKNKFYNPVKQALGHVYRIKELLSEYHRLPIVPIVVFVGEADIRNINTQNAVVYDDELLATILEYDTIHLSDKEVEKIQYTLQNSNIRQQVDNSEHVQNIHRAVEKFEDTIHSGICPRCGGKLIERKGKYGTFYGCSNYPKCKFTIS